MSKTKEEILQHHYIHDKGLVNPVLYVHNSMDEYASQAVQEYKEKLRAGIQAELDYYNGIALSEHGEGHLSGLKKAFDLL